MALWRNCATNAVTNSPIPSEWMAVLHTGPEGGICWEEVPVTITPKNIAFEYDNYSSMYPLPTVVKLKNTSSKNTYKVNMATDTLFQVLPNEVILSPNEESVITVSVAASNMYEFGVGKTEFRLQTNITKL